MPLKLTIPSSSLYESGHWALALGVYYAGLAMYIHHHYHPITNGTLLFPSFTRKSHSNSLYSSLGITVTLKASTGGVTAGTTRLRSGLGSNHFSDTGRTSNRRIRADATARICPVAKCRPGQMWGEIPKPKKPPTLRASFSRVIPLRKRVASKEVGLLPQVSLRWCRATEEICTMDPFLSRYWSFSKMSSATHRRGVLHACSRSDSWNVATVRGQKSEILAKSMVHLVPSICSAFWRTSFRTASKRSGREHRSKSIQNAIMPVFEKTPNVRPTSSLATSSIERPASRCRFHRNLANSDASCKPPDS